MFSQNKGPVDFKFKQVVYCSCDESSGTSCKKQGKKIGEKAIPKPLKTTRWTKTGLEAITNIIGRWWVCLTNYRTLNVFPTVHWLFSNRDVWLWNMKGVEAWILFRSVFLAFPPFFARETVIIWIWDKIGFPCSIHYFPCPQLTRLNASEKCRGNKQKDHRLLKKVFKHPPTFTASFG